MNQVGRLKYIADKWSVDIDGYSIPFPSLKLAQAYLAYIRLWASRGEIISYDHANKTLFWAKGDAIPINQNPASRWQEWKSERQRTTPYENTTNYNRH